MPFNSKKMNKLITKFDLDSIMKKDNNWISIESVQSNIIIDQKKYHLIDCDDNNHVKYMSGKYRVVDTFLYEIIKKLKYHPEHYNAHKILGFNIKFRKQDEITILSMIYDHYRSNYNMHYQHPALDFKIDTTIDLPNVVIEASNRGGIAIEIDETGHGKYNPRDHEERQKILEASGYYFIRIKPGEYTDEELIEYIDNEINNYQLVYSNEIDVDSLWKQLKTTSIDKQFFDAIGKSIVCTKKFCVDFDDLVSFLGYGNKSNGIVKLKTNYKEDTDYLILTPKELNDYEDDIVYPSKEQIAYNNKYDKVFIFLTKNTMYSFILECQTKKAKMIRKQFIEIYYQYNELLVHCRQQLLQKNFEATNNTAIELYNKRQDEKHTEYKQRKNREIQSLKKTLDEVRRQSKSTSDKVNDYKYESQKYKKLYTEIETEISDIETEISDKTDSMTKLLNKCKKNPSKTNLKKYIKDMESLVDDLKSNIE